ncbi:MAG: type II toxin-antitoxin system VapC family toxin [Candidatus Omnitrophica bacterium]|nr:type II toxin-antitoxin system VapC family toxin [Candidatus Omnitrophota bacterium]
MMMIDSSGWLEYFLNGNLAKSYAGYFHKMDELLTPTIVLYEVYKKLKKEAGEEMALLATGEIQRTQLALLTDTIAYRAADISLKHRLAMADSIIYATACEYGATLVTSDEDFKNLPGVRYFPIKGKP